MIIVNASADVVITEGKEGGNNTYLIHPQANTTIVITDFKLSDKLDLRLVEGMKAISYSISPYFTILLPNKQSIVLRSFKSYDSRVVSQIMLSTQGNGQASGGGEGRSGSSGGGDTSLGSLLDSSTIVIIIVFPVMLMLFILFGCQFNGQKEYRKAARALKPLSYSYPNFVYFLPEKKGSEESSMNVKASDLVSQDSFPSVDAVSFNSLSDSWDSSSDELSYQFLSGSEDRSDSSGGVSFS